MEAVQQKTVDWRSTRNSHWRSRFPGPVGTAMAPTRSHPAWKPTPAVQRP